MTKEQIFEWIRYTCVTDTDAEQVAEIITTKLAEENGSSHNKQSTPLTGSDGVHCCRHCGFYTKCCVSQ